MADHELAQEAGHQWPLSGASGVAHDIANMR
jgi:hypothetical protein